MKTLMIGAVALALLVSARADDEVEALKPKAAEACLKEMGHDPSNPDHVNADIESVCVCMIEKIVTVFDKDAAKMLKILASGLQPSQSAEIAALLGISEAEVTSFLASADANMRKVQQACME